MSKSNANKKQIKNNYRLAVFNEDSYEEKFALSLSKRNIFLAISFITLFVILITTIFIFYTPVREYIPGYDTTKIRIQAIQNLEKIDSIMISLQKNKQFIESFSSTINKQDFNSVYADNQNLQKVDLNELNELKVNINVEDSILRKIVEIEDRFNIIESENNKISIDLTSPASGLISEGFSFSDKHFGVDIVLKERTPVKSISDGIVIFSAWTLNYGYTVVVYHKNKLTSIYKHNESIKVKKGDFVMSGEVIALSGNTGDLTTGPHLHFEIWDSQGPLNPEDLISF